MLVTFSVRLIHDNRDPDIEPCKITCKSKDGLVCLIQSSGYTGAIWLSYKDQDGTSYKWCTRLDAQGMAAKFCWGVPWNGIYQISTKEPANGPEPIGPTGVLVVGTQGGDGDRSGRCT